MSATPMRRNDGIRMYLRLVRFQDLLTRVTASPSAKTGANLSQTHAAGTIKPTGATHFLVFSKNDDGEMATGVNLLINDK